MTALARPTEPPHAPAPLPIEVRGLLTPLRDLVTAVRSSEYLKVGGSRRFRAVQRRRTRFASRIAFLGAAAALTLDALGLIGTGEAGVQPAIAIDMLVVLAALGGWWLLPRGLYRYPEAAVFVVMLGITVSAIVTGTLAPALSAQTAAYLLLLPTLLALVMPWGTVAHLRWLLAFTLVATAYVAIGPAARYTPDERANFATVLLVSIGASVVGHVLLQRGQIRGFAQLERIHALRRRTEADHRELERLYRELERTARIDPLTGAGNRRRLHEDLLAVRSRIGRSGATYGLMEIDLDNFKAINDRLGHLAGDDVLRRVVEAVQAVTRLDDSVYRYGGEEFVVVMPMADRAELLAVAERIRVAVLELAVEHPANADLGIVSVSIGATLIGDDTLDLSDEEWFWAIDRAMYAAKDGGRNQVHLASEIAA
jgi:diguanylate cyclase (GGDEF)-like protein